MNCINKYNNKMLGVGISDKPRNYYRIYFGLRKRKWWWYIVLGGGLFSSSLMPILSTYALITYMVLKGNIYDLIMIQKGNSMYMNKPKKKLCRGI